MTGSADDVRPDQVRRGHLLVAVLMQGERQADQSSQEASTVTFEDREHGAAQLGGPFTVVDSETLGHFPMRSPRPAFVVARVIAMGAEHHVVRLITTVWHVVGRQVGDSQDDVVEGFLGLP